MLIPLMQASIDTNTYDFPYTYFMCIHQVWQHQINIKLHDQIDVNVQHNLMPTVDVNLMSTVDITYD